MDKNYESDGGSSDDDCSSLCWRMPDGTFIPLDAFKPSTFVYVNGSWRGVGLRDELRTEVGGGSGTSTDPSVVQSTGLGVGVEHGQECVPGRCVCPLNVGGGTSVAPTGGIPGDAKATPDASGAVSGPPGPLHK